MINPKISAVWSTTKPIAPFSCTPRVQEVHSKAEVVYLTPGLLGTYQSWGRTPYPWSPRLRDIIQFSRIENVLRNI